MRLVGLSVAFLLWCGVGVWVITPGIRMLDHDTEVADTCGMEGSAGCKIDAMADNDTPAPLPEHFVQGQLTTTGQLLGKPSFLWRAGRYCAYCREKIPQAEELILQAYSGQINTQLFTMNFDTQKFDTLIPQVPFEIMSYESFAGTPCDMFPTWVVLDSAGVLVSKECWGTGTIEQVALQIQALLDNK
jgi:hypothetical protein